MSREKVTEDLDQLKYYLNNTHPSKVLLSDKRYDELILDLNDLNKKNIAVNFNKELKRVFGKHKQLGISLVEIIKKPKLVKRIINNWSVGNQTLDKFNVGYIKINDTLGSIRDFNNDFVRQMDKGEAFVIDLRYNDYISSQISDLIKAHFFGINVNYQFIPQEHEPKPVLKRYYVRNWFTKLHDEILATVYKKNVNSKSVAKLKKELDRAKNSFDNSKVETIEFDLSKLTYAKDITKSSYKKPTTILVGAKCAENCELLVNSLRQLANIQVVGQRTAGRAKYESYISVILPNSGAPIAIPTSLALYKKEFDFGMEGVKPDVYLKKIDEGLVYIRDNILSNKLKINNQKSKEFKLYFVRPYFFGSMVDYDLYLNGKEKKDFIGKTNGNEFFKINIPRGNYKVYQDAARWTKESIDADENEEVYLSQPYKPAFWHADAVLIRVPKNTGQFYMKHLDGREGQSGMPSLKDLFNSSY